MKPEQGAASAQHRPKIANHAASTVVKTVEGPETKESHAEELEDNSVVQAVQEVHERSTNHKETQLPRPHV